MEEVLTQITNTCKQHMQAGEWSKNDAMRYVYIEIGKRVSKSARFFFSVEGKYGECGLPVEEMEKIHFAKQGTEVTCYVTAKMMKDVFSNLGIKSEIIQSFKPRPYVRDGKTLDVYHSYLVAEGDDDKKYFLSPNMDLLNIKHNFAIEHFANAVPYYYNGVQTYQGEEIDYSTLTPAELLEIDKKIGYAFPLENIYDGKTYYVYANKDRGHDPFGKQKNQAEQYLLDQIQTRDRDFLNGYTSLFQSFEKDGKKKTNFSQLDKRETREIEWYVFSRCLNLAKENMNISDDDADEMFFELFNSKDLDLQNLQTQVKKYISQNIKDSNRFVLQETQKNPFRVVSSAMSLLTYIENVTNPDYVKNLSKTEKANHMKMYQEMMQNISKLFLTQYNLDRYIGDKEPTNLFVMKKIKNSIEKDFECDTSRTSSYRPEFCKMGAVEQSAFMKQYLRSVMKPEFSNDDEFLPRIMFSALSDKGDDDSYAYLIHIKSKDENANELMYSLVYDPKTNQINAINFLELKLKYNVLSKTVMKHLSETSKKKLSASTEKEQ